MLKQILGSPLIQVNARYGAIAGVICVIFVISLFYMGMHPFLISPFLDFRVFMFSVLIFFSLRELRDYHLQGEMYYWQGMAGSFVFLAFGSAEPRFVSGYVEQFTQQIRNLTPEGAEQIGKDALAENLERLPETSIGSLAGLYAWQCFGIGFFISVIISVILRKQPQKP